MPRRRRPLVTDFPHYDYRNGANALLKTPGQAQDYLRGFGETLIQEGRPERGEMVIRSMQLLSNELMRHQRASAKLATRVAKLKNAIAPKR